MNENLNGMSTEQLMLRDLIWEIPEILQEADAEGDDMYRLGVRRVARLLQAKLESFQVDQSNFARQMPDIDAWFEGRAA